MKNISHYIYMNSLEKKQINLKKTHHNLIYIVSTISIIISLIIGYVVYKSVPQDQKKQCFMGILGTGILIGAFLPQLIQNNNLKSKATDSVIAVFLILTSVGVLLRFPALKTQLDHARLSNNNLYIQILMCIGACVPLIAHIIWAWQCAIFDSEKALHEKKILQIAAPILSVITIIGIIWMFAYKGKNS